MSTMKLEIRITILLCCIAKILGKNFYCEKHKRNCLINDYEASMEDNFELIVDSGKSEEDFDTFTQNSTILDTDTRANDVLNGPKSLQVEAKIKFQRIDKISHPDWNISAIILKKLDLRNITKVFFVGLNLIEFQIEESFVEHLEDRLFESQKNSLEKLKIVDSEVVIVEASAFSELKSLKELKLTQNKIKNLDANTFYSLETLETIDLSSNQIEILHPKLFFNNSNLTNVDLSSNLIEEIPINFFSQNLNLKHLSLSSNRIKYLSAEIFGLAINLESLNISNNQIYYMEYQVYSSLAKLQVLDVSYNQIDRIYDFLPNFEHKPKSINLGFNQIFHIDKKAMEEIRQFEIIELLENVCIDEIFDFSDNCSQNMKGMFESTVHFFCQNVLWPEFVDKILQEADVALDLELIFLYLAVTSFAILILLCCGRIMSWALSKTDSNSRRRSKK